jgi:tryptophan halogenase
MPPKSSQWSLFGYPNHSSLGRFSTSKSNQHEQTLMRIAVIGGGTAGFMAAAHLTKHFSTTCKLYHIYDSRIPTIGVGEGTTPAFAAWLHEITGLSFYELQQKCLVTRKFSIQFENWGDEQKQFNHNFHPKGAYGYHLSAAKLVSLLQDYVIATCMDKRVSGLESTGLAVQLTFEDNTRLEVDFAFDARGFPAPADDGSLPISGIPTNAAVIRRAAPVAFQAATRSVARPHGWIFVIPLTSDTAYGYIYNAAISSPAEVEADFDQFLKEEQVEDFGPNKWLRFPNFMQRTFFDGALFKIGNTASFLEPLEATAIGIILLQLKAASLWLLSALTGLSEQGRTNKDAIGALNDRFFCFMQEVSLFISWHYARGSAYQTPFWQFAQSNFERTLDGLKDTEIPGRFAQYLQNGAGISLKELEAVKNQPGDKPIFYPAPPGSTFGGYRVESFAEIGHGLGYFSHTA